ncbi:MAG: recombinase family protein [Oligoflexia bacterium]|nr:recombinase family protein [Oligoflexia bacterium]
MENNSEPQKKRRTALYARVSTDMQSGGLESQIRALRIFCEQNNITDFELFADEGISGTKQSRPGLDRMMAAVENGEVDAVIVFAFSRFARSVTHMLKGLETMKKHKTNFVSLSEKLDLNTSLGHVVFVIISAISQLERDLIAERVRNGLANARAKGKRIGRLKTRNSVLIRELLDSGLPHREIARIARCSHGSVSLEKKGYLAEKQANAQKKALADAFAVQGLSTIEPRMLPVSANLIEDQTGKGI